MSRVSRTTSYVFDLQLRCPKLIEEKVGPRNMDGHSKLPYFMRMHGSVTPRMLLPLAIVGGWATCITCISQFVYPRKYSYLDLQGLLSDFTHSRRKHPPPHSPRFRSRSRPLIPQHNRLRAILRRPQVLGHPLRTSAQPRPQHLGTH